MPAFPKPKFTYNLNFAQELAHLKAHKAKRKVPAAKKDRLLLATWNIANLGLQIRQRDHYRLMAEVISWFDIIAVQEVNNNLGGLRAIESELPSHYNMVFTDAGGNNERSCFIYNGRTVGHLELIGELAIPPKDHRHIKMKGVKQKFTGFDRNPFLCSFSWRNMNLVLVTVHSFFGKDNTADRQRRSLETYAISRWADLERRSKYAFSPHIITMGDFNLPKVAPGDPIYDALVKRGLELPEHTSKVYSNITDDKQYDQIAFLPGIKSLLQNTGIYDMDNALFPTLWQNDPMRFRAYMRYYISDHRPLWMELSEAV